jgi:two-component system OmpR family response regulator
VEPGLCILVVDDEFDVAELLSELLAARGHKVTTAINGLLARGVLASTDFDLVITDFMMPMVDGIELVQGMREDPRLARVPVIMISAQRDLPAVVEDELVQATLQKPFSPAALYAAILRVYPANRPEACE